MSVADAVERVRARVTGAAARAGRDSDDVRIVAVVKGVPIDRIVQAFDAGLVDLGENRARDLRDKAKAVGALRLRARWHFVGPLQTNKVRYLDEAVLVHSVDRVDEAAALHAWAERQDRSVDALVQVNVARERTKQGIDADELDGFLSAVGRYPRVRPRGFMLMAPQVENPEDVRWIFKEGKRLQERFAMLGLRELSMGMSDDFEVAVEEGATIVRIGRAIFGER